MSPLAEPSQLHIVQHLLSQRRERSPFSPSGLRTRANRSVGKLGRMDGSVGKFGTTCHEKVLLKQTSEPREPKWLRRTSRGQK